MQIAASGTGTVSVGARLGGYSGGIPSQGYTAEIESNGTVNLWRVDNFTLLGTSTISGFSLGTWYTLGLRANGSAISVEVNGSTVIGPVTNTAFTSGNAGVWSYSPNAAGSHRFDNFSVTVLGGGVYRKAKGLAMVDARRLAVVNPPPANTTYRVYYFAAGRTIAMREMPAGNSTGTLYYLHSDHLGSTSVTTNASGAVVARQWYYPFGSVRGSVGTLPTQRTFTGQYTHDAALGSLMHFNARYMSPALGRFVSADTVVPEAKEGKGDNAAILGYHNRTALTPLTVDFHELQFLAGLNAENAFTARHGFWFQLSLDEKLMAKAPWGPQYPNALNRYAYGLNNPLRYVDPTGHEPLTLTTLAIIAVVAVAVAIITYEGYALWFSPNAAEHRAEFRRNMNALGSAIETQAQQIGDYIIEARGGRYAGDPRTAQQIIGDEKQGKILGEFPSELLNKTYDEIKKLADAGVKAAQTAKKLLDRKEYDKDKKK